MLAKTGQKVSQLLERVYGLTGRLYYVEESMPATPEMRIAVPKRLKETPSSHIGPYPVVSISHMDGTKLLLENDNWALLRFSGTEPVLRLTVEADTPEKAKELLQWLRQFVHGARTGKSRVTNATRRRGDCDTGILITKTGNT